ncbi:MAG: histidine phosphatase family protein [Cyanobacteria bacterium P01_F01_bin.53]
MQPLTRVILVRHGRSTFNEQGRYQGSSNDSVLTEQGRKNSWLVGQHLKQASVNGPIDFIYTSPLRRVQQTADEMIRVLAPSRPPPVITDDDLKEISLSLWEGMSYQRVQQQFASQYHQWRQCPAQFELPIERENPANGEISVATETYFPIQDLYHSARKFWTKVLSRHTGNTLLIVSHGGTIHALLSTALGLMPDCHHSLQQSNSGISELVFSGTPKLGDRVQLHQLNQTTVLGEPLPKLKVNKQGLRLLLVPSNEPDDEMTTQHFQRLAERIKGLSIDFCLSSHEGQPWLHSLVQQHPNMLCLGSQNANFLDAWQQHLGQSYRPDEPLITGLVIAPTASIQKLLSQVLTQRLEKTLRHDFMKGDLKNALSNHDLVLRHGHLSIVHYPHNHRPVVQAINL